MQAIDLGGRSALITGGSRGIGRATALAFVRAGANVTITYERNSASAEATLEAISEVDGDGMAVLVNLRSEDSVKNAVEEHVARFGSLDYLVTNAGIWEEAAVDEMSLEEFNRMMEINMGGTFLMTKHAVKEMKANGSGSIVIISSTAGQRGESFHSHYAASKGAQISFTKSLAAELAPTIRVNCVAPGWVNTDMTSGTLHDEAQARRVLRTIPLGRVADPSEIANAVVFLASPLASFITGEILNVNGGAVLCG